MNTRIDLDGDNKGILKALDELYNKQKQYNSEAIKNALAVGNASKDIVKNYEKQISKLGDLKRLEAAQKAESIKNTYETERTRSISIESIIFTA